ncbi:MAG: hypothetical protein DI564_09775 [Rhodanobacter denitrificans]|uniref:Uncharacterized protein n=1 Tax=Rhodanobacter denitrificans TaxID=666685 RepID=A0A2W5KCQ8_9GAMM|nr:MAG: hypothetical protein DI564_09775 [Rhodanobacter denitrificans]
MYESRFPFDPPASPLLGGLPELAPDPALWSRIADARRRQLGRRRFARAGGSLAAAVLFAAAIVILPRPAPVAPDSATDLSAWLQQSQALEQEWSRLESSSEAARGLRSPLRRIDAALQAAYDRGASDEELAPLWEARSKALRAMIDNRHDAVATLRI